MNDTPLMPAELDHLVSLMREEGLCQRAHYKELYLPKAEIEGKNCPDSHLDALSTTF